MARRVAQFEKNALMVVLNGRGPATEIATNNNSISRTASTEITRGPFRRLCRRARLAAELKGKENLIRSDSYLA
jgi:hypothetical protein